MNSNVAALDTAPTGDYGVLTTEAVAALQAAKAGASAPVVQGGALYNSAPAPMVASGAAVSGAGGAGSPAGVSGISGSVATMTLAPEATASRVAALYNGYGPMPQYSVGLPAVAAFSADITGGTHPNSAGSNYSLNSTMSGSVASQAFGKTRLLFSSGGNFERKDSHGVLEYVGGETRLLSVMKTFSYSQLLEQLANTSPSIWEEGGRIMYELPGSSANVFVDLLDDEDVANMWEECEDFKKLKNPSYKLHLYFQLAKEKNVSMGSSDWGQTPVMSVEKVQNGQSIESKPDVVSDNSGTGSELISEAPKVDLLELEAKLEVITPDQLEAVKLLGIGGYGEVYLAKWHSSEVAVKCLNPRLFLPDGGLGSATGDVVTKLLKEGSMLGSLRHPNVVWVYGIVLPSVPGLEKLKTQLQPGQSIDAVNIAQNPVDEQMTPGMIRPPALVTEYMTAGSVRNALCRKADFINNSVVRVKVALDTVRGMEYLHSKKIVHFDLKTANLLMGFRDKTPVCKVADFGLSKQRQATYVTGVNSLRGTLPWTAPEVILTPKAVTEKVDVYSFAIVMWELWTGREPFEGMNFAALLHAMGSDACLRPPIPGSAKWEGEVPPEPCPGWCDLMQKCWQQHPTSRPTFRELLLDLEGKFQAIRSLRRRGTA